MKGAEIMLSKINEMDNTLKFQEKGNSRMQSQLFLSKALDYETIQSKMKKIRLYMVIKKSKPSFSFEQKHTKSR